MTDRQLAKVIADSISPHGVRLTTMEIQLPRIVLAEFNTHRVFSRSSASSRAIPIEKMLARVIDNPYIPEQWERNGAGMQGHGLIEDQDIVNGCERAWLRARDRAVDQAGELLKLGVHKQTTNRLLEPFMWHTIIVTATEWSNFFHLRCSPMAHPAIRNTAEAMRTAMGDSSPRSLDFGEWHLPYINERDADLSEPDKVKVSTARCARVSYLTHDGIRDPAKDIELHDSLLANGHMSPFEHVARPMSVDDIVYRWNRTSGLTSFDRSEIDVREHFAGNFRGWVQYRKTIAGEADILATKESTC
jgi:thymidylate synthase ThyX